MSVGHRSLGHRSLGSRKADPGKTTAALRGDPREEARREQQQFTRRAALLGCGQLAVLGALGFRLHQLQVVEAGRYAPLADDNRINTLALAPLRGRIRDRFGALLADNAEAFRVMVVPALVNDLAGALERLAQVIPVTSEVQAQVLARAKRQPANLPIIVAGDLPWEQIARINLFAPELPGVETETWGRRLYYHGTTVGHVVGHVGAVERIGLGDDPVLRIPGMRIGRTGVERGMESRLRGVGGALRREVDVRGRIMRNLFKTDPQPGRDVVLTIDLELQKAVLDRLSGERRAAAVALDIASGEVVAMGSVPTYDPADVMSARTASAWRRVQHRANDPLVNRATSGLYPPGSTFKIVTALAALEAGVVDLRERIECDGSFGFADRTYRCWKRSGHGRCDLHRALRESCDCYHYEIARRLGIERLAAMAQRLGLGQIYPAGISPQSKGVVPTPSWKRGRFGKPWLGGETLIAGIGQGYVLATPLQLAVMTARAASGRLVLPTLVRPDPGRPPAPFAPLGISDRSLIAVNRGLRAVVNEDGGTGSRASLGSGEPLVAGKTGTSQVNRRSTDRDADDLKWEERDHALFVGYFPADAPRYAVAAVIEHGGGGGAVAAPLVRDIMQELVKRDPMRRPAFAVDALPSERPVPGNRAVLGRAG